MKARIVSVANQKGGVGKTTTLINLGAYLSGTGRKVLLVDADPQGNATTCIGYDPRRIELSLYDVLIDGRAAQDIILTTERPNMELLPSNLDLAGAEVEMTGMTGRESLLIHALAPLQEQYDYIFIDCPPSLGLLTVNGLTAATGGVLIPVQCEYLALEGLSMLLNTIQQVRDRFNTHLNVLGVLLTMYDARTNLSRQVVSEVKQHFPKQVFNTTIPRNVRLSEAPSYGQTILSYAPESAGGQAYASLAVEFIHRVERKMNGSEEG